MAGRVSSRKDPDFAARVRASFDRQAAMKTLGATLAGVEPGRVVIELPWAQPLTQQHGFLHAGMVATALDSACGYAAFTPDAGRRGGADHRVQDQPARAGARASAFAWKAWSSSRAAPSAWSTARPSPSTTAQEKLIATMTAHADGRAPAATTSSTDRNRQGDIHDTCPA